MKTNWRRLSILNTRNSSDYLFARVLLSVHSFVFLLIQTLAKIFHGLLHFLCSIARFFFLSYWLISVSLIFHTHSIPSLFSPTHSYAFSLSLHSHSLTRFPLHHTHSYVLTSYLSYIHLFLRLPLFLPYTHSIV